jgi:hypothetical protein
MPLFHCISRNSGLFSQDLFRLRTTNIIYDCSAYTHRPALRAIGELMSSGFCRFMFLVGLSHGFIYHGSHALPLYRLRTHFSYNGGLELLWNNCVFYLGCNESNHDSSGCVARQSLSDNCRSIHVLDSFKLFGQTEYFLRFAYKYMKSLSVNTFYTNGRQRRIVDG